MREGGREGEGEWKGEAYNRSKSINYLHFNHTHMMIALLSEEIKSEE